MVSLGGRYNATTLPSKRVCPSFHAYLASFFTTDSNIKVTQRQQNWRLGIFGGEQATDLPRPVCIVRSQADGLLDRGTLRRCRGYLSPMTDNGGDWQGRAQIKSPAGQWETWQLPWLVAIDLLLLSHSRRAEPELKGSR